VRQLNQLRSINRRENIANLMTTSRLPLLDAMKGIGCIAIVLHHLAVYGPMSDVVRGAFPTVIDGLEIYARLAVQMFFVLAGFLVATQLAPEGKPSTSSATSAVGLIFICDCLCNTDHRDRQTLVCTRLAVSASKPRTATRPLLAVARPYWR
jgi:hypothetical protein